MRKKIIIKTDIRERSGDKEMIIKKTRKPRKEDGTIKQRKA